MFDSVEFDNGFLLKLDFEEKKINLTDNLSSFNDALGNRIKNHQEIHENNSILKKSNYYDLSLSVQDISESISRNDYKVMLEKKICNQNQENSKEKKNICLSPLSPIKGSTFCAYKKHLSFSSTPLRDNINTKNLSVLKTSKEQTAEKNDLLAQDITDYAYIDADLFEEWNDNKVIKNTQIDKNSFTVSQAINFIETAEQQNENEEHAFDNSIDLLTGEIIQCERNTTENLFLGSMNLSNTEFLNYENKKDKISENYNFCLQDNIAMNIENVPNSDKKNKSSAVQKLNFGNINSNNFRKSIPENVGIGFESDDSFDAIINFNLNQNLEENDSKFNIECSTYKLKSALKLDTNTCKEVVEITKSNNAMNLSDSCCFNTRKKKGKSVNIIESDSGDEEYFSNIFRQRKIRNTKKRLPSRNSNAIFLDFEAEVSDDADISSDESMETLDEYEGSFIDEKSYLTQNNAEDLTTKYLESVKCIENHNGRFKIPKTKPYSVEDICSQISPNKSSNYEFDSFCVNEIEFDEHLSDLEIAEQILEMDRKKNKKIKRKISRKEKTDI